MPYADPERKRLDQRERNRRARAERLRRRPPDWVDGRTRQAKNPGQQLSMDIDYTDMGAPSCCDGCPRAQWARCRQLIREGKKLPARCQVEHVPPTRRAPARVSEFDGLGVSLSKGGME